MTQLNQNTTNLQSILDAVNALPEAISVSGEISITENGVHDVKKYASANVNVKSAPVLLWTNASPTSDFAAQTVRLAGGYDAYLVECKTSKIVDGILTTTFLPFFTGTSAENYRAVVSYRWYGARRYTKGRVVRSAQDGQITFGIGFEGGGGASSGTGDYASECIPTRIWGVKFTL